MKWKLNFQNWKKGLIKMLDRIKKLAEKFEMSKGEDKPNFDDMSEDESDRWIKIHLERSHKEDGVFSLEQALEVLHQRFVQGLINKDEYDLMVEGEKDYWVKK